MDTKLTVNLIITIIAAINAALAMAGLPLINLGEQDITTAVNVVVTLVVWAYSVWHNFNFTRAAKEGQKVTDELKANRNL